MQHEDVCIMEYNLCPTCNKKGDNSPFLLTVDSNIYKQVVVIFYKLIFSSSCVHCQTFYRVCLVHYLHFFSWFLIWLRYYRFYMNYFFLYLLVIFSTYCTSMKRIPVEFIVKKLLMFDDV